MTRPHFTALCGGGGILWITATLAPVRLAHPHALFKVTQPIAELIQRSHVRSIAILHQVQEDHHVIPLIAKGIETRI